MTDQTMTPNNPESIPPAAYLVLLHEEAIQEVKKAITETNEEKNYKEDDPHYAGIIKAKNDQLKELEDQLRNYKAVMARTTDYDVAMRESHRFSGRLPALAKRDEIDKCIETFEPENRFLIVQGETGSGKSTQLPQYIADHPRMAGKKVICTQPRKIAAISLADRVSDEYACGAFNKIGVEVGYSVGGSKSKTTKTTRIEFMTEGRMLERVINRREKDFENVGAIILDEAHERSIICDILLGMLKKSVPLWSDILIVVASATIDLEAFAKFFDNQANIVKISGRMYPVQRKYRPIPDVDVRNHDYRENGDIIRAVAETALEIHNSSETTAGDILCFLPGAQEVHLAAVHFEKHVKYGKKLLEPKIYELSGRQEAEEQREVFEELDPKIYRKIIFASPIAETSITINGVVHVIDSGYKKETTFDPQRNISALKTVMISRSSSLQREGRAGRTQPGVCYKLYSEEDFEHMSINQLPEILRRPLPLAIIYLRRMGIDPSTFDWISAPLPETIKSAEEELVILGALDDVHKQPTALGNLISYSQQEPKIVRMIYTGMLKGAGKAAIRIAALLSVSKFFFYGGGRDADKELKTKLDETRISLLDNGGDILTLFKLYDEFKSLSDNEDEVDKDRKTLKKIRSEWIENKALSRRAINTANTTVQDLEHTFSSTELWKENGEQDSNLDDEGILRLFCSGFFLHAARRVNVKGNPYRYHYFALETEVVGSLPYKASLSQTANDENEGIADWILFDQILKYPDVTIFPTSSKIELGWIKDESEAFYEKCSVEQENLPTEIVEVKESETVLRRVLGKRLVNLPVIEDQLGCSLDADLFTGSIRAFCCKLAVEDVANLLQAEVENVKQVIRSETIEHLWLGNTRLVIGSGYQIALILFAGEFDTFCLYNLSKNWTRKVLKDFVLSKIDDPDKISNLQIIYQVNRSMAMIKLKKSTDAALFMEEIKNFFREENADVGVAPQLGELSAGAVPRAVDVRLKITWPLEYSTGNVTIFLKSPEDGNKVIDLLPTLFRDRRVIANAFGQGISAPRNEKNKAIIQKIFNRWIFITGHPYDVQPDFKVRGKNLPEETDEFELIKLLNEHSITPLRVFFERDRPFRFIISNTLDEDKERRTPEEIKKKKLDPCKEILGIKKGVQTTDIFDRAAYRAGVYVQYPDRTIMEKAFFRLRDEYLKIKEFDQPCRVDLEKIHNFSVHIDLYECLRPNFDEAVSEIKNLDVWVVVNLPKNTNKKSKFVYIKYRHIDDEIIQRCRQLLEAVVERDLIDSKSSPNVENLFAWTGRLLIKEEIPTPSKDYYLHWNYQNFEVYIYGISAIKKKEVTDKLINIIDRIEKWKEADLFEIWISLDRKKLEIQQKRTPKFIDSLCEEFKLAKGQYRLVGKSKLVISMDSSEELEKFKAYLDEKGLLVPNRRNNPAINWECGLCFCEVEPKFMVTSLCNHPFCMSCIQNMFSGIKEGAGVQKMPLCCPADKCEQPLPIEDIKKVVPHQVMPKLDETVLNIYLRTPEGANFRYCPKPGCNQIFKPTLEKEDKATFHTCDNCLNNFCLECTEFLKKEIAAHPGMDCDAVRAGEDHILRKLMNQVRDEILTLRCPRCKTSFYDYEGCAALTCSFSSCNAGICALCLADCQSDAHSHVLQCKYNPTRSYYVDQSIVKDANRKICIEKLNAFFRDSLDANALAIPNIKSKLKKCLSRDLSDLGINASEIHVHEETVGLNGNHSIANLVNQIRNEILTLQCPNCKAAYFDFDGCAALTCNSCFVVFCALCLESFDEEDEAYRHVRTCSFNELRDLHVSKTVVDNANRIYRTNKLKAFFRNTPDLQQPALKSQVISQLLRDFEDLKINADDIN